MGGYGTGAVVARAGRPPSPAVVDARRDRAPSGANPRPARAYVYVGSPSQKAPRITAVWRMRPAVGRSMLGSSRRRRGRDTRIPERRAMDPTRFDALARSLAAPQTRRSLLGSLAALGAGLAVGARAASAQSCPPGQTANKKGVCACPGGTDACNDGCFALKRDPANCGRCGNACLPGEVCQKGECRCPRGAACGCPAGEVPCNGSCTSADAFRSDAGNCGACGNACGTGGDDCRVARCDGGVCVTDPLDCEDGNPCTSNRCNGGCVTGFLSGGTCSTAEVADGTCETGTCVANPATTTTTTTTSTTTSTTEPPTTAPPTTEPPTTTTTTTAGPTCASPGLSCDFELECQDTAGGPRCCVPYGIARRNATCDSCCSGRCLPGSAACA